MESGEFENERLLVEQDCDFTFFWTLFYRNSHFAAPNTYGIGVAVTNIPDHPLKHKLKS